MDYFKKKQENISHARNVVRYIEKHFSSEIATAAKNTIYFLDRNAFPETSPVTDCMDIEIKHSTTVDAIFEETTANRKVCALNFASYKEPGGMFLDGSMAQEESLCHAGILYGVLTFPEIMEMFYKKHKTMLNRGLYHSDLLYSPDIIFIRKNIKTQADIITCAAPNRKAAQKYQMVSDKEVTNVMRHRITSILYAAYEMKVDTLILGAFGCGVFGNVLSEVSLLFKELLEEDYHNRFHRIVFAVPDRSSYETMKKIIRKDE